MVSRSKMTSQVVLLCVFVACSALPSQHLIYPRSDGSKNCKVFSKPALHEAMDRICDMCHEMFSHNRPNTRADCRSKCFRNEHFRDCLKVFNDGKVDDRDVEVFKRRL